MSSLLGAQTDDGATISAGPLLDELKARITRDQREWEIAYFHAVLLPLEYIAKLGAPGVVPGLGEELDGHRGPLEYTLGQADALGKWVDTLNAALTGAAAQYVRPLASSTPRNVMERVAEGPSWPMPSTSRSPKWWTDTPPAP